MNRTKLIVMAILFAILLLITATLVMAVPPANFNYGTAMPDGNEGEWDTRLPPSTPTNLDWVAFTCPGGSGCTNANATGDLFLRFDAASSGKPNHGTLFVLWLARGIYNPDNPLCGKGGGGFPCDNWVQVGGTVWDEDSQPMLYPGRTYPGKDVWAQLTDGKGWEVATIEWPCDPPNTNQWNFQGMVNGSPSTSGPLDLTFACTGIGSTHGPTGPAGSITFDTLTISSTLTGRPTGTVDWFYCYRTATTLPPSSSFPNGCLPTDSQFNGPFGSSTITRLYTPPPSVRVAWNTSRGGAIPILLGPILAPLGTIIPNITVTTQSPNFTPTQMGTYCYYATYVPSPAAQTAGYTAMAHTNNSTECFVISLPTAVSISSMNAQAGWPSANLPLLLGLWAGAVVLLGAGVVGVGKLLRMF